MQSPSLSPLPHGYALRYAITSPGVVAYRVLNERKGWMFSACEVALGLCRQGDLRLSDVRGLAYLHPDIPQTVREAAIKALAGIRA